MVHAPAALATRQASFSEFLAPLTKNNFKKAMSGVEGKLSAVHQTLSMLSLDSSNFEALLNEMLSAITWKTGDILGADRTTIYIRDEEQNELWSILAKDDGKGSLEIRMPVTQGIAGEVATTKKVVNIPFDFYDDHRSEAAKASDKKTGYRTYTMLTLPLLNEEGELVAVVQLLNKLKGNPIRGKYLSERIDTQGFTQEDEALFEEFSPLIRLILESSRSFYVAMQRQRAAEALLEATRSLASSSLDLESTLKRVMDSAKKLMSADRSTLWLLDEHTKELWAKIPQPDGSLRELRVPVGKGYVGKTAQTGKPLNILFDLYDDADSEVSREVDQKNGYRTCSLLCMPIFNAERELIGVTQLVNKRKQGEFPTYKPDDWPHAPECWKASFNRSDREFMEAFNIQAGVAIQNAKLFEKVKQQYETIQHQYAQIQQQEQLQRDILRSLSNGVLSADAAGRITAANLSAKRLLGLSEGDCLEGQSILDVIRLKGGDFPTWVQAALAGCDEKSRQQYYPDQTLVPGSGCESHSVHLSINSIAGASGAQNVGGVLVVMDDISDEKRIKNTMYRYMTQELAEQLIQSGDAAKLGGDRKEVSILFSDIRGYTKLVESMQAEEVVSMLNEYFSAMVEPIFKYKGTLDKYIGDAIMGVFGSPVPLEDHPWKAVQTALEMRASLAEFNARRLADQKLPIRIGIGIHSGAAISGNIGHARRMEFTVIGDDVNLASRLEGTTKLYGCDIAISGSTYQCCGDMLWVRELDIVRVKGKNQPVSIYELVGLRTAPISETKQRLIELYEQGRKYYLNRQLEPALEKFEEVLSIDSHDYAALLHRQRCQNWIRTPLPEGWDGIETLTEK
ncbi:GAF domain-containing protein [Kamptonema formosum]|uniref:GAF domain-containing protein n=1 Tax=Kamptonema formosum TaxID=331992 RepID=UPI00034B764C|nr:adenylate/guanylate cyclase domain-containing protein [Oscillatoria sp. PCC 10802]